MIKEDIELLKKCRLFDGIEDVSGLISEFGCTEKNYEKREVIKSEGDNVDLGIILEGSVIIYAMDFYGNRHVINIVHDGDFLGGAHAFGNAGNFNLYFEAEERSRLLFIKPENIKKSTGKDSIVFLLNNLSAISTRCLSFLKKIEVLSKTTIREKVLSFLTGASESGSGKYFTIPFSRQEFADYLCCDRSALSAELGRMRNDGLIDYKMNTFKLLKRA